MARTNEKEEKENWKKSKTQEVTAGSAVVRKGHLHKNASASSYKESTTHVDRPSLVVKKAIGTVEHAGNGACKRWLEREHDGAGATAMRHCLVK